MENKKEKKGGSKVKIIIIALVVLLVVGVGSFFGYNMFLKDKSGKENKTTAVQQIPVQQVQQQSGAVNTSYLDQVVSEKTFELDEFLVNLADEDGKRYLKAKVSLGYNNKKLDKELEEKKPVLRDAIISILRTKKAADIGPKNMNNIKMEIIQRINTMLKEDQLNNIYFNDILVQ
ncbi:flagellar basal body-associated FliL family protein [Clostridium sp. A1-XYC3]|uniref:Flagellar protein FliL n=1 Tax=Clostridium tanneri TaxID=3037988 RepID=A0ABU4JNF1_9CLOT|nr:flagellar basal body-associated FliL family protein [Clostridium sp. A1-XYC3]MDW8799653.1 flagellar basal body-associated FliL family protein [Clostridium sp. A1-XYC3]